jgi:hypothetical protein
LNESEPPVIEVRDNCSLYSHVIVPFADSVGVRFPSCYNVLLLRPLLLEIKKVFAGRTCTEDANDTARRSPQ